jgi:hypothetical protein
MADEELLTESAATHGNKMLSRWNGLVRRARIGRQLKGAALTVSSYANPDGTSIKCGVARFATDCEIGYSTARRYLAWLRDVGLLELVRAGNHKAKRADEYRLVIAPAAYERLDIPDDEQYRELVEGMSGSNRSGEKARRLRSLKASADSTDDADTSALTMPSADTGYLRSFSGPSALGQGEPLPSSPTFQVRAPSTGGAPPPDPRRPKPPPSSGSWTFEENSLAVAITPAQDQQGESLPQVRAIAPVVEIRPGAALERPHWMPPPRSPVAENAVAEARAAIAAARRARKAN